MKVLHVINGEFYSGAERVQDLLALRLPDFGYEVGFCCLKPGKFPLLRVAQGASVYETSMASRFDFSPAKKIAEIAKNEGYSVLHTHTPRAALIGKVVAKRCSIPMIHHVHSPTSRDTESPWRNFLNSAIENWSLGRCERLVAVSHSLKSHLVHSGFAKGKIAVVPNGVPVTQVESRWKLPQEEWVIGTVALFRPRKGLEVLIEALASLVKVGVRVRLRAVGGFETVEYERSILALAESLGISAYIDWTGFTSNVNAEFEKMHLFVLPSLYGEGLPMVVIEAMAAGLPVIGSRVEGIPEVLGNDEFGFVVEPGSADAMQLGIRRLIALGEDAARLAAAGHARQRDCFSDVAMARGVAEVYRGVLG